MALSHSVVVCTSHRLSAVRDTIDALGRTELRPGTEVLVVNNGDAAHTNHIGHFLSAVFGGANELWRCLHEPTPGLSRARNRGLAETRGDIVSFLDDDTSPCTNMWQRRVLDAFTDHPEVGMVGGPIRLLLPSGSEDYARWRSATTDALLSCLTGPAAAGPCGLGNIYGGNASYRRIAVGDSRFDDALGWVHGSATAAAGEEYSFHKLLNSKNWIAWFEPTADVWHRVPPERLTRQWMLQRAGSIGRSIEVAASMDGTPPFSRKAKRVGRLCRCSISLLSFLMQRRTDYVFSMECDFTMNWAACFATSRPRHHASLPPG